MHPEWEGLPVIPSRRAAEEMYTEKLMIHDIIEVLEAGYDCARSKRREGVIERCVDAKNKKTKVVAVRSYNYDTKSEVWVITHVGRFTRR